MIDALSRCRDRVHGVFVAAATPVVDSLVAAGVSANAVTSVSLLTGALAGLGLALSHFGWAALPLLIAYAGDALDGPIARRTQTASVAGALFDASVDRYQEFFALGGLAIAFRTSVALLVLALFALAGSFMVSYGSAKADGLQVRQPGGLMRRPERAACLWAGVALTPAVRFGVVACGLPPWVGGAPIAIALSILALAANVSAIRRLREIAGGCPGPGHVRRLVRFEKSGEAVAGTRSGWDHLGGGPPGVKTH